MEYDINITNKADDILKTSANGERMINYNFFFETGNLSINNYDFYKKLGTLYDLFYDLITEKISFKKTVIEKNEMIKKLEELKDFILSEEKTKDAIKKAKTKTQRKKILATQKRFLSNALRLYDKRTVMINALIDKKNLPWRFRKRCPV